MFGFLMPTHANSQRNRLTGLALCAVVGFAGLGGIAMPSVAIAADNDTRPATSTPRSKMRTCDTNLSLCNDVADIDQDNCEGSGKDCAGEFLEDRKECASDYSSCIGAINKIRAMELKIELHRMQQSNAPSE